MNTQPKWVQPMMVLVSVAIGFAGARGTMPRQDAEIARELARQGKQLEALTLRLGAAPRVVHDVNGLGTTTAPDSGDLRTQLVTVLREELRSKCKSGIGDDDVEAATISDTNSEASLESQDAVAKGQSIVDTALSTGRWGDRQVSDLRSVLPQMTASQRAQIFQILLPAINDGSIRVESAGPPI